MSLFTCPICSLPLIREGQVYRCSEGHCYDVSREGYVNLLPANRKHSKNPGDDKAMAASRARFLDGGWYSPLRDALCSLAVRHMPDGGAFLDAGCGEGYYTQGIFSVLAGSKGSFRLSGIDISKSALKMAARRVPDGEFAVASVYRLPVSSDSISLLLDCFSPLAIDEYRRVLRPGGVFIYVVPAPRHLIELKNVLYERPYENSEDAVEYQGFEYLDILPVSGLMSLDSGALLDLFHMTPYAWKTPKEGVERLEAVTRLDVTMDFRVHIFRRLA